MRVLVTGAAGLIGSGIAARLRQYHDVIGLDLQPGPEVRIVDNCFDVAQWRQTVGHFDAAVHVAALHAPHVGVHSNAAFRKTNVEATSRLLDLAVEVGASHFVLTSTTSLYGHALEPNGQAVWVDEELPPQPRDIYDETKLQAEELAASAGNALNVTSLRMSRCFPEAADVMAWYRLYRGVDRRDVAEAHALALTRQGPPATFVISAATPFRREDCAELFADAPAVIERRCPGLIDRMTGKGGRPPQSIDRVYDASASRELGFSPRHGIESALAGDWDPFPAH
jgi:nucleoside-diphosphate-sugar epimerase